MMAGAALAWSSRCHDRVRAKDTADLSPQDVRVARGTEQQHGGASKSSWLGIPVGAKISVRGRVRVRPMSRIE